MAFAIALQRAFRPIVGFRLRPLEFLECELCRGHGNGGACPGCGGLGFIVLFHATHIAIVSALVFAPIVLTFVAVLAMLP